MSRRDLLVVLTFALAAVALVVFAETHRPTTEPRSAPNAEPATSPLPVVFFDGGYVVGPYKDLVKVLQASGRGSRTACQEPPPTAEERAQWVKHRGASSTIPFKELVTRDDATLVNEVTSRLLDALYGSRGFAGMSRAEQNVLLSFEVEGEVINGGIDQFFVNAAGNCSLRTVSALGEMGLTSDAHILSEAMALFPDASPSEDRSTRFDQLDALGERRRRFTALDSGWEYAEQRAAAYIRANASAFSLPP